VTGSRKSYLTATKSSAATAEVTPGTLSPAPVPTIAGSPTVGSTLTVVPGTWGPSPVTLSYQWFRDGKPVFQGTASTRVVRASDLNHQFTVAVTGVKPAYSSATRVSAVVTIGP
jgi:hypothetical protein